MPRTITITVPDSAAEALALYQSMFTPAFLVGILEAALRRPSLHSSDTLGVTLDVPEEATRTESVSIEVLEKGLARFAAEGRRGGNV